MNSWYIDRIKKIFLYDSLYNCLKLIYDISKGKDFVYYVSEIKVPDDRPILIAIRFIK